MRNGDSNRNKGISETQGAQRLVSAGAEPFPEIPSLGNHNDLLDTSLCAPCVSEIPLLRLLSPFLKCLGELRVQTCSSLPSGAP